MVPVSEDHIDRQSVLFMNLFRRGNMIQRHSIVLWRKPEKEDRSFEEISKEAFEVMDLFQSYPQELRPNYLPAWRKEDVKEFEWNYDNFRELLKNGVSKEGDRVFLDLGYSIYLFSSLDDEKAGSIWLDTGITSDKFVNSLIVDLPVSYNLYQKETADMISGLFVKLVQIYKPFFGCISNSVLSRKYGKYLEGNLPTSVHWMNYWTEDIIHAVGMDKIQNLVDNNPTVSFENGILSIRDTALDVENEDDMRYHESLQNQLFM